MEIEILQDAVRAVLVNSIEAIMAHRDRDKPLECVGLVCTDGTIYPLINQARSHKRFEVSTKQSLEAIGEIRSRDRDPLGMYHSHTTGDSSPSNRDILWMQENPMTLSIIAGKDGLAAWLWDDQLRFIASVEEG